MNISYRNILNIALPLSLGAFVQFLVVLTDNLFLSRVSEAAINGAGNGGMLYITAIMLGIGLSSGLQILIARRNGEGKLTEIGTIFGTGLRMAMLISIALYIAFILADRLFFSLWVRDPEILTIMREFLDIRALGLFVYMPVLMLNSVYIGVAKTKIISITMIVTALGNILLDWLFITGVGPFPEMKHEGAALATLIAEALGMIVLVAYTIVHFKEDIYELRKGLFHRQQGLARHILGISLPLMVQQMLALATWTAFYFMVEKVGSLELKVSHIVRNSYMLAFVVIMGVSYTTRTVISTLIAEERQGDLLTAMRRLIVINFVGAIILAHGLILYPRAIAEWFFEPGSEGIEMLVKSFRVVFFAILLFSINSIFLNTVEGSGKTRVGMFIEMLSIVIYLTLIYQITIVAPQPIHVIWMSDYLYFGVLGLLSLLYLWRSDWKHNKV